MQQQQKPLPQTEDWDWQTRLAERMASKTWKGNDPILASLTIEESVVFALAQKHTDRPLRINYFLFNFLVKPIIVCAFLIMILMIVRFSGHKTDSLIYVFGVQVFLGFFTESPFTPKKSREAQSRQVSLDALLMQRLPLARASQPELSVGRGPDRQSDRQSACSRRPCITATLPSRKHDLARLQPYRRLRRFLS